MWSARHGMPCEAYTTEKSWLIGAVFLTLLLQNNPSQRTRDGPFDACARKRSLVRAA
jgi:hypothetical protein